ncbi:DNA glycosylase [Flammula alnicola]|nr:DNA glycosylase [Flammula alnicola]
MHSIYNASSLTTPKKKGKGNLKAQRQSRDPVVESPYFSASKRLGLNSAIETDTMAPKHETSLDEETGELTGHCSIFYPRYPESSSGYPFISKFSNTSTLILQLGNLKPILIQDRVAEDPWKLLVAVTLLNKTAGKLAIPTFWNIMAKWPTPLELSQAHKEELVSVIRHLGTQNIRAERLIALSRSYIQEPPSVYDPALQGPQRFVLPQDEVPVRYPATPISHLPGTGQYALDSYRVFCTVHDDPSSEEWKTVMPTDKELIRYLKWKWAFIENMEWSPTKGAIRTTTHRYLSKLIVELQNNITSS